MLTALIFLNQEQHQNGDSDKQIIFAAPGNISAKSALK
jgi:hypothetical protein